MRFAEEQRVIRHFDELAGWYANSYQGDSPAGHFFTARQKLIGSFLSRHRGGRILDCGCGAGMMAEYCVNLGFEFFGIDISKGMIQQCQEQFGHLSRAHFSVGRIQQLDFEDRYFDVILSMGVLEYLQDVPAAIEEMTRVLKPGGTILFSCLNRASPCWAWGSFYEKARARWQAPEIPPVPLRAFTEAAFRRLVSSRGLQVTDLVYFAFNVVPAPLDNLFPRRSAQLSRRLERLGKSPLKRLGTAFLAVATQARPNLH